MNRKEQLYCHIDELLHVARKGSPVSYSQGEFSVKEYGIDTSISKHQALELVREGSCVFHVIIKAVGQEDNPLDTLPEGIPKERVTPVYCTVDPERELVLLNGEPLGDEDLPLDFKQLALRIFTSTNQILS